MSSDEDRGIATNEELVDKLDIILGMDDKQTEDNNQQIRMKQNMQNVSTLQSTASQSTSESPIEQNEVTQSAGNYQTMRVIDYPDDDTQVQNETTTVKKRGRKRKLSDDEGNKVNNPSKRRRLHEAQQTSHSRTSNLSDAGKF